MAANTSPIYCNVPNVAWSAGITAANTAMDGTGTVNTIFTAGSNGSRVEMVRVRALGTNVKTVMRIFINNGSSNATPANNVLYAELALPATTATSTDPLADQFLAAPYFPLVLPAGYKLNVTIGTAVAAGVSASALGGNY